MVKDKDKKGKDLIKSIIADVSGKDIDKIELEDLKCKKKKRSKKKKVFSENESSFSNDEGLNLDISKVSSVDWKEIKSSRNYFKKKESLDEWSTFDFFNYTSELYEKMFKNNGVWNLKRGGASLELKKIYDLLEENFGFKSNLMVKDYIEFFFKYFAKKYKNRNNNFYFSQLKSEEVIKSFVDSYNFRESFRKHLKNKEKEENSDIIKVKDINASYENGILYFLLFYGIIIPFNWFLFNKKMSKEEIIKIMMLNLKEAKRKNFLDIIINSTEKYSPYPEWFLFKKVDYLLSNITGEERKINVSFVLNENIDKKYNFIKRSKKR